VPDLDDIDRNEWYSNGGPLVRRLEARLATHAGSPPDTVVVTASGTAALTAALLEACPTGDRYCLLPGYSFAACPAAALGAGLTPYFVDCDPVTGVLDPWRVRALCRTLGDAVGAVMPVSVFGRPLDPAPWRAIQADLGVPVVADAAWCIDTIGPDQMMQTLSLHATKALGAGEGGAILARNAGEAERLRRRLNFGFDGYKRAGLRGINGKMGEYTAAVAHAALDQWPDTRAALARLCDAYDDGLADVPGLTPLRAPGETWVSGAYPVRLHKAHGRYLVQALAAHGIQARCWWRPILPEHAAFARYPASLQLQGREVLEQLVNLPMHSALDEGAVARICHTVRSVLPRCLEPSTSVQSPSKSQDRRSRTTKNSHGS
jgi:dTDP-4-amino-4,6-dideoxygalactose transaminase